MSVVLKLGYMLALLGAGLVAKATGVVTESRRDGLTFFAFYVALPALVFSSTYAQPISEVVTPTLMLGLWAVMFLMIGVSLLVHRSVAGRGARSVAIVQSYHSNFGFLGLPLVASTFGPITTAKASIILGAGSLTQVPVTIAVLVSVNDADVAFRDELIEVLKTPVIPALVTGLLFSYVGLGVPSMLASGLDAVASLALPIALVCVGASLSAETGSFDVRTVGSVVGLKVFVMPALALLVFSVMGSDWSTVQAGVTMFAAPTAVSTFVYTNELGGDPGLASMNVFVTTVVSVGTLLAVLRFLL